MRFNMRIWEHFNGWYSVRLIPSISRIPTSCLLNSLTSLAVPWWSLLREFSAILMLTKSQLGFHRLRAQSPITLSSCQTPAACLRGFQTTWTSDQLATEYGGSTTHLRLDYYTHIYLPLYLLIPPWFRMEFRWLAQVHTLGLKMNKQK